MCVLPEIWKNIFWKKMEELAVKSTITNWMLEYYYYLASNEYIENNTIEDDINRDLIQGK